MKIVKIAKDSPFRLSFSSIHYFMIADTLHKAFDGTLHLCRLSWHHPADSLQVISATVPGFCLLLFFRLSFHLPAFHLKSFHQSQYTYQPLLLYSDTSFSVPAAAEFSKMQQPDHFFPHPDSDSGFRVLLKFPHAPFVRCHPQQLKHLPQAGTKVRRVDRPAVHQMDRIVGMPLPLNCQNGQIHIHTSAFLYIPISTNHHICAIPSLNAPAPAGSVSNAPQNPLLYQSPVSSCIFLLLLSKTSAWKMHSITAL